jgi:hypothetical protein
MLVFYFQVVVFHLLAVAVVIGKMQGETLRIILQCKLLGTSCTSIF